MMLNKNSNQKNFRVFKNLMCLKIFYRVFVESMITFGFVGEHGGLSGRNNNLSKKVWNM